MIRSIPRPVLLFAYEVLNFTFDQILYPAAEYLGGRMGGSIGLGVAWAVMALIAIAQCAGFYALYKYRGVDIAGVGYLEAILNKDKEDGNWFERLLVRMSGRLDLRNPLTFVFLIASLDPYLLTIAYERREYKGARKCDWLVFWLIVITANLWWGFRSAILAVVMLWISALWSNSSHLALIILALAIGSIFYASPNPFIVDADQADEPFPEF